MCCCGKPIINGQAGYKWQPSDAPGVYPVNPPDIPKDHVLIFDEPGRCGKLDSHSHHFRVTRVMGGLWLHVRHGAGDEHCQLGHNPSLIAFLETTDSDTRYWLLSVVHRAYREGRDAGSTSERAYWRTAAIEKRIKLRKKRGTDAWVVDVLPHTLQRVQRASAQ